MANPQLITQLQPHINNGGCCSVKSLFFSPIRFCGRQWMWVRSDNNNQISQVVLKILAAPFLACATLLSGLTAVIGALVFSADNIPNITEYNKRGDINLLRKAISNEEIAENIRTQLSNVGYEYSVEVRSMDREIIDGYYLENIHRYVTVTNSSSTAITRFWEVLKNHFYNKDVSSLNSLYPCIYGRGTDEGFAQLKDVLALHRAVTFSMAFDLAYVRTELGKGLI